MQKRAIFITLVIGSVLYLIQQVRDNTTAVKGATYQSIVETYVNMEAKLIENPEIVRIYNLAKKSPENISEEDAEKIIRLMSGFFNLNENLFYQHKKGLLDTELWKGWCKGLRYQVHGGSHLHCNRLTKLRLKPTSGQSRLRSIMKPIQGDWLC